MIDTHCHFFDEEFKNDLEDCINRCKENGIEKMKKTERNVGT